MKKYRKINLRKESPAKLYAVLFAAIGVMAYGFATVPAKKPVQEVNPVVLYQPSKKAKAVLYKPKNERARMETIAQIWGIKKDGNIHQLKKILEAKK